MGKSLVVRRVIVAVAAVARPALADLGIEGATADGDACDGLDGLWLAVVVVASGDGTQGASLERDAGGGVDALATVATTGHGECAASHGEVVVALDACSAAVVVLFAVVEAVAGGGNGGCSSGNDDYGVALDATCCVGCDADVECAVVYP